jgi:hypothetical protein
MKNSIVLSLCILLAGSCASHHSKVALPPQDVETSSPNVARIYVLDDPKLSRGVHGVRVEADDKLIGVLDAGGYVCWERDPGQCLISVVFEKAAPLDSSDITDVVDVSLEKGDVYYYGLTLDPIWKRPKVRLLDRADAREMLAHLKPAQK